MLLNELIIDENNMGFIPSLGISFQLNDSAKEIIGFIREGKSKDEIVRKIDVDDFFKKLQVYGLL
jgi:hypothetical protein